MNVALELGGWQRRANSKRPQTQTRNRAPLAR